MIDVYMSFRCPRCLVPLRPPRHNFRRWGGGSETWCFECWDATYDDRVQDKESFYRIYWADRMDGSF